MPKTVRLYGHWRTVYATDVELSGGDVVAPHTHVWYFDGDGYVDCGNNPVLYTVDELAYEVGAKPVIPSEERALVFGATGNNQFRIWYQTNNAFYVEFKDNIDTY